jgi:guanosine-3',5'-bis(diphosphate) 3'-pyrophosphohydrolase
MTLLFIDALKFASEKHIYQHKKGCETLPYINHPVYVAHLLIHAGETDEELLAAALLHDVLEDTDASVQELQSLFGLRVTNLVIELTDDNSITYDDRKRLQIQKAPKLSADARKIKIADKIANIQDLLRYDFTWSKRRKKQYLDWSRKVVGACRGISPQLEQQFDGILIKAYTELGFTL